MKFEKVLHEDVEIGDEVLMGKFRNKRALVKGFGTDKNNQPTIKTTKGERAMYSFRLSKLMDGPSNGDKYHAFFKKKLDDSDFTSIQKMSRSEKRSFFKEVSKEWAEEKKKQ